MGKTITSLLVGMHFRPPAKQVLACLPAGAALSLQPEPENPYDPSALKVFCGPSEVPEACRADLAECLTGTGFALEELFSQEEPLQLGYVAASGGKPLLKAGLTVGNKEFLAMMAASPGHSAKLAFGADGAPLVMLTDNEQVVPEGALA